MSTTAIPAKDENEKPANAIKDYKLFLPAKVGAVELKNRIVMSPMTRCRATGNIPNQLMAAYYAQRSGAGLIITEGTSPSPNGLGYARIPGIFNKQLTDAWKKITSAVHNKGGKIFLQLMHTGRISHPLNMPDGAKIIAPSAIKPAGQMWTDSMKMQDFPVPNEMTGDDIINTKGEYVSAAKNAMEAGFDGVELHGANGYLPEQFISPFSNIRNDNYGGSIPNRCRFAIEVVAAVAGAIGKGRTGIRLSPYGVAGDMHNYPEIDNTYNYLSEELNKLDIAYIHLINHFALSGIEGPLQVIKTIRNNFKETIILNGGYSLQTAEVKIENMRCDLVAFGRLFINNPDLVDRFKNNWPLAGNLYKELFYSSDEKGYTDYPAYKINNEP